MAGRARNSTSVAALVDTNVLVYRFDPRFPDKQARATELLRAGVTDDSIRVPHQALIEFIAATTKPLTRNGPSILPPDDARREMEEMLVQFEVLYPDEELVNLLRRAMPRPAQSQSPETPQRRSLQERSAVSTRRHPAPIADRPATA